MSDDLVERLRRSTAFYHADCELKMACADRIEELAATNEELEAERDDYANKLMEAGNNYTEMHLHIEQLEAKLAKAVEALELALELADNGLVDFSRHGLSCDADINKHYRTTLAELSSVSCANLKGQDYE